MLVSRARVHQHRQRDQCAAFSMRPFSAPCAACWCDWVRSGECDEIEMRYFRILLPISPTNSNMQIRFEWNSHARAVPHNVELWKPFCPAEFDWIIYRQRCALTAVDRRMHTGVNFMASASPCGPFTQHTLLHLRNANDHNGLLECTKSFAEFILCVSVCVCASRRQQPKSLAML